MVSKYSLRYHGGNITYAKTFNDKVNKILKHSNKCVIVVFKFKLCLHIFMYTYTERLYKTYLYLFICNNVHHNRNRINQIILKFSTLLSVVPKHYIFSV